jgi:2-haloalkanoic acid dehalogenase type II
MSTTCYDAVLFDLLSGLIDSWSLWNDIAGGETAGREWRGEYLRLTYDAGSYRSYEAIIGKAARASSVPDDAAERLIDQWDQLTAWPEAPRVLAELREEVPLGVVTNCSTRLGRQAADTVGVEFDIVSTAERAGWYKPNPEPYELALEELSVPADRTLFVSGSGRDVPGATDVGMAAVWHNRIGLSRPDGVSDVATFDTLDPLSGYVLNGDETGL